MREKIAVATVSGKAYYLIVDVLKAKNVPFLSLKPTEPIPVEVKVVITTEKERHVISHEKVLAYDEVTEPEALVNEALRIVQGKEHYEKLTIGIDPGETFGLAVLADGKIIETANCSSIKETLEKVENILRNLEKNLPSTITVKIGDGVPSYKERLLHALDEKLPHNVVLESVSEAGTSRYSSEIKHRRIYRDIISAQRIAGRNGHTYQRRWINESDS
jgi:hypothetical protein